MAEADRTVIARAQILRRTWTMNLVDREREREEE
jgi:hypothetical protein